MTTIYLHATIFVIQNFTGNKDQDSVVYHELNPPISARYIRFLPQAWVVTYQWEWSYMAVKVLVAFHR